MQNRKNLGKPFEDLVTNTNIIYRKQGYAIIEKQHTECKPIRNGRGQVVSARYYGKATVDYIGRTAQRGIAFDCKHCEDDKISLSRLEEHQQEFLEDWSRIEGSASFVLVSFKMLDFYLIPWDCWKLAEEISKQKGNGKWGCTLKDFTPSGRRHIKKEELPEAWKVGASEYMKFDYLQTVQSLWGGNHGT